MFTRQHSAQSGHSGSKDVIERNHRFSPCFNSEVRLLVKWSAGSNTGYTPSIKILRPKHKPANIPSKVNEYTYWQITRLTCCCLLDQVSVLLRRTVNEFAQLSRTVVSFALECSHACCCFQCCRPYSLCSAVFEGSSAARLVRCWGVAVLAEESKLWVKMRRKRKKLPAQSKCGQTEVRIHYNSSGTC